MVYRFVNLEMYNGFVNPEQYNTSPFALVSPIQDVENHCRQVGEDILLSVRGLTASKNVGGRGGHPPTPSRVGDMMAGTTEAVSLRILISCCEIICPGLYRKGFSDEKRYSANQIVAKLR